jgi:hypothetical protein
MVHGVIKVEQIRIRGELNNRDECLFECSECFSIIGEKGKAEKWGKRLDIGKSGWAIFPLQ